MIQSTDDYDSKAVITRTHQKHWERNHLNPTILVGYHCCLGLVLNNDVVGFKNYLVYVRILSPLVSHNVEVYT